jgi:hypothetical protein
VPRQIIDTESSRPAYVRRRIRGLIVWLAVLLVLVVACWFLVHRASGQETRAAAGSAGPQYLLEEKGVRSVALTLGETNAV